MSPKVLFPRNQLEFCRRCTFTTKATVQQQIMIILKLASHCREILNQQNRKIEPSLYLVNSLLHPQISAPQEACSDSTIKRCWRIQKRQIYASVFQFIRFLLSVVLPIEAAAVRRSDCWELLMRLLLANSKWISHCTVIARIAHNLTPPLLLTLHTTPRILHTCEQF